MNAKKLGSTLSHRLAASKMDRDLVARLLGVSRISVDRWCRGKPPRGDALNALWHLLAIAGVPSPELDQLDPFAGHLGRLLALGVITTEEALQACGVINSQSLWQILRGEHSAAGAIMTLEQLQEHYRQEFEAAFEKLKPQLPFLKPPPAARTTEADAKIAVEAAPTAEIATRDVPTQEFLAGTASRIGALLPLMRMLQDDSTSAEIRSRVRELAGPATVFELAALLTQFNSERARDQIRKEATER